MYKHSKNAVVKIGGYVLFSFFAVIIMITFGIPAYQKSAMDQSTAAIVNGQRISLYDLNRTVRQVLRDQAGDVNDQMRGMILDQMISQKLESQYSKKLGVKISDDMIADVVKKAFSQNGVYNEAQLTAYLNSMNISAATFFDIVREDMLGQELRKLMQYGTGVSTSDAAFQNAINKAQFQVKYSFLSNEDLAKRVAGGVNASDAEITEEMNKNKAELKDPETDREVFKAKILERKMTEEKKKITSKIDEIAVKGSSFDSVQALLGGKVGTSEVFKPGDPVKESGKDGKVLFGLADSDVFRSDLSTRDINMSSRAVISNDGIYIFTPIKRDFVLDPKDEAGIASARDTISKEIQEQIRNAIIVPFNEKSTIVRLFKGNDQGQ